MSFLRRLLEEVAEGRRSVEEALRLLRDFPYSEGPEVRADTHRALRRGFAEAVYGPGKTPEQVCEMVTRLRKYAEPELVTRATAEQVTALKDRWADVEWHPRARVAVVGKKAKPMDFRVAVVTAGTSDLPVAEECAVVAEALGLQVTRVADVGVAGLHRLLAELPRSRSAQAVVVVAGMEGSLPGGVAGLVEAHENPVLLRTLRKAFCLARLGSGYAVAHPEPC